MDNLLQTVNTVLSISEHILVNSLDTFIVILKSMLNLISWVFSIFKTPRPCNSTYWRPKMVRRVHTNWSLNGWSCNVLVPRKFIPLWLKWWQHWGINCFRVEGIEGELI